MCLKKKPNSFSVTKIAVFSMMIFWVCEMTARGKTFDLWFLGWVWRQLEIGSLTFEHPLKRGVHLFLSFYNVCISGRYVYLSHLYQSVIMFRMWEPRLPKDCQAKYPTEIWRCYFGHRFYHMLKSKLLMLQPV